MDFDQNMAQQAGNIQPFAEPKKDMTPKKEGPVPMSTTKEEVLSKLLLALETANTFLKVNYPKIGGWIQWKSEPQKILYRLCNGQTMTLEQTDSSDDDDQVTTLLLHSGASMQERSRLIQYLPELHKAVLELGKLEEAVKKFYSEEQAEYSTIISDADACIKKYKGV
jgi:hypothetical protein